MVAKCMQLFFTYVMYLCGVGSIVTGSELLQNKVSSLMLVMYILMGESCRAATTLQSIMNAKLSNHRFWPCHKNGLIKTIQTIPHNLHVSVKPGSLY